MFPQSPSVILASETTKRVAHQAKCGGNRTDVRGAGPVFVGTGGGVVDFCTALGPDGRFPTGLLSHRFLRVMLGRLVLLFLLTPAIELGLLIQVDRLIGFWPTIGLIAATGIAGSYLARREGLSTWRRLNERLRAGDLPGKELADGVIILVAGALLITPGVLTDAIGFLGLLPPTRALVRRMIIRRLRKKMEHGSVQVQFGVFGGSGIDPTGSGRASSSKPSSGPKADGHWQGDARRVPGHVDDGPNADTHNGNETSH